MARADPRKKPRAAFRRFMYPAPNACWQLDATEYVLTLGRNCAIFQLIDDYPAKRSHPTWPDSEIAEAAIAVMAAHGVPQRLLTDNGTALNPTVGARQASWSSMPPPWEAEQITCKTTPGELFFSGN